MRNAFIVLFPTKIVNLTIATIDKKLYVFNHFPWFLITIGFFCVRHSYPIHWLNDSGEPFLSTNAVFGFV
jgi:hypothetical protein